MNRTSGGGPFTENPIAGVLSDGRQARARSPDPRPGLRLRLQPRRPQQGRGRADRRRAGRPPRGVRGRARRDPRRREAEDAGDRLRERGRMAEDVTPTPPAEPQPEPIVPRQERARRSSYRLRFGIIYVLLAAVVGAGIGSFIVLATGPEQQEDPAWSAWQPKGSTIAKVRQIADRIPKAYRTENGAQLTVSLAGPLSVPTPEGDVPVRAVFVRPDTSKGLAEEDDIAVYPAQRRRLVRALRDTLEEAVRAGAGLGRTTDAAAAAGTRALALHAQVRRQRRLGRRLHASGGDEPAHGLPASERRLRRARAAAQLAPHDGEAEGRRPELARGGPDPAPDPDADVLGGGAAIAGRQPRPDPDAAERRH